MATVRSWRDIEESANAFVLWLPQKQHVLHVISAGPIDVSPGCPKVGVRTGKGCRLGDRHQKWIELNANQDGLLPKKDLEL